MNSGRTVFAQMMDFLPLRDFRACVTRYGGQAKGQSFSCLDQFLALAFAQLTGRESLRDIVTCLNAMTPKLYHMGFRSVVRRSTLADANEQRDWRIYADFAQHLIGTARPLYAADTLGLDLEATVYALDATLIDLCLSVFPWARFRHGRAAVKLHTLLDLRGAIPTVIHITPGHVNEVTLLDALTVEPGAIYIMDRGYIDFTRFRHIAEAGAFFVTRAKTNTQLARVYSHPVVPHTGVRSDHTVRLTGRRGGAHYPLHLRRIRFDDPDQGRTLTFLTNAFEPPAATIAALYKRRWHIELFFKWIKQHLHIKSFYGTTENAVKTQIWTAISGYVLVAIIRKRLHCELSLYTVLQIFSVSLFEKVSMPQLLTTFDTTTLDEPEANQLPLFDL